MVIEGEAGIGKTTLWRQAATAAGRAVGFVVASRTGAPTPDVLQLDLALEPRQVTALAVQPLDLPSRGLMLPAHLGAAFLPPGAPSDRGDVRRKPLRGCPVRRGS
jgi:hypothetical protein